MILVVTVTLESIPNHFFFLKCQYTMYDSKLFKTIQNYKDHRLV